MNDTSDQKGNIFIGEGVTVTGSFSIPRRAVVNGTLNGELSADELLVGKQGRLNGQITVRNADVHGETNDTLTASNHLVIRGTGRVNGRASYGELEIERGGLVAGTIVPASAANGPGANLQSLPVLSVRADDASAQEAPATATADGNDDSSGKAG